MRTGSFPQQEGLNHSDDSRVIVFLVEADA